MRQVPARVEHCKLFFTVGLPKRCPVRGLCMPRAMMLCPHKGFGRELVGGLVYIPQHCVSSGSSSIPPENGVASLQSLPCSWAGPQQSRHKLAPRVQTEGTQKVSCQRYIDH